MKSKIATLILTIILLLTLYMLFFYNGSKSYSYELNSSNIAVMVFDSTENDYKKQNTIPTGNYAINMTLSHCNGDSVINGYDHSLGKVSTSMYGDDICFAAVFDTHFILEILPKYTLHFFDKFMIQRHFFAVFLDDNAANSHGYNYLVP